MIIAVEGIDGSGKSTLARGLAAKIPNAIAVRELSSTALDVRLAAGYQSMISQKTGKAQKKL